MTRRSSRLKSKVTDLITSTLGPPDPGLTIGEEVQAAQNRTSWERMVQMATTAQPDGVIRTQRSKRVPYPSMADAESTCAGGSTNLLQLTQSYPYSSGYKRVG